VQHVPTRAQHGITGSIYMKYISKKRIQELIPVLTLVGILIGVIVVGSSQRVEKVSNIDSESFNLPSILAAGRVDARGEKHYFLSAGTTNGSSNGYSGLDSFCENDANAISGRKYHVFASNATGRGFSENYIYSNSAYGTFNITESQSPDICRVLRISCDDKWINNSPGEYVWNTTVPSCNDWTTSSENTGNFLYQPFRASFDVGLVPVSSGNTWNCNEQRRVICIENTVTISNDVVAEPFYVNLNRNWTQARDYCTSQGAYLAYIGDAATNATVKNLAAGAKVWIGFNDRSQEGNWDWEGGFAETYTAWNSREPNNAGNEDCAEMYSNGGWNDARCSGSNTFVCSYSQ
jgi:hypothetical protein